MDFIFMLTRNDRTVEDAGCLVDQVCELGVTHVGFKDVGVPAATMRELVSDDSAARRRLLPRGCKYNTRSDDPLAGVRLGARRRSDPRRHRPRRRRSAFSVTCRATFRSPAARSAIRRNSKDPRRWSPSIAQRRRAMGCGGVDLLAYRATQADPLDLVRAARGALAGGQLIVAGSVNPASRSTRSPKRAPMRSRSDRRCSMARSRRRRGRCAARSSTSSRRATRRPAWPHEHCGPCALAPGDRLPVATTARAAHGLG